MFDIVIEVITLPQAGRFSARVTRSDKLLIASSRQPFCDAARALLAAGCDPNAPIVMRHAGSEVDALRSTVGAAAKLTVAERDRGAARFGPWKAHQRFAVEPPMRQNGEAATTLPADESRTSGASG